MSFKCTEITACFLCCYYNHVKLSKSKKCEAMQLMDLFSYSCGASLQDIPNFEGDDDDRFISKLFTSTNLTCISAMEKPYYVATILSDHQFFTNFGIGRLVVRTYSRSKNAIRKFEYKVHCTLTTRFWRLEFHKKILKVKKAPTRFNFFKKEW